MISSSCCSNFIDFNRVASNFLLLRKYKSGLNMKSRLEDREEGVTKKVIYFPNEV